MVELCYDMKRNFLLSLLLFAFSLVPLSRADETVNCKVRAAFSSTGSIGETVLQEIRQTRSKVSLALYGFDNPVFVDELTKVAARGVTVRVKIDAAKGTGKKESRLIEQLEAAGIRVNKVAPDGRNHNKFVVIDESKVITGSYNWTLKAEKNWENLLILDCPELAQRYEKEWETIR